MDGASIVEALFITRSLKIPLSELSFSFGRSPGPGGQNVNKLNTRAELRFDLKSSSSLSEDQRQRLMASLGSRLTRSGMLIVRSSRFRTQGRNKEDCLSKFAALLAEHLKPPPPKRRPTRPSRGAVARRLESKRRQAQKKALRRRPSL